MKLMQSQVQKLSMHQLQSVELLQLSTQELEAYIQELSMDNPFVEPEEPVLQSEPAPEDDLLHKLKWLEDNDYQNRFYQNTADESLDPLLQVPSEGGLEETLFRFLSRQINQLNIDVGTAQIMRYLAACLDDNGYFRIPLSELSDSAGIPVHRLKEGLKLLRRLEPAGVGAADLAQCLELQLRRIRETGPALTIAQHYLPMLAKRHYRDIASKMGITVDEVVKAQRIIQELEPRPGAVFQRPTQTPYILPDVFVEEEGDHLVVRTRKRERPPFRINAYYRTLLENSEDEEVHKYLTAKLHQVESVLYAISQRESTLQRCAQYIVDRQTSFFYYGPQALLPMRMADAADTLGVHESTISRTVREKYLQCSRGVYPLSYFFSRAAVAGDTDPTTYGGTAARALLHSLIDEEDKSHPLSDQKLSELMAVKGCPISRRTVAKYREEMNVPNASGRRERP